MEGKNYLHNLNPEQLNAVQYEGKHLLVLAGAGTGKTRTIISRAMYLMDKGVSPFRIVILSFTRKSANEIVGRIKAQDKKYAGVAGQTFHSWCMGIIKRNPNIFECSNATCLDEEDSRSAIGLICGKKFKDKDNHSVTLASIQDVLSYMRNVRCSLTEAMRVKIYDNGDITSCREKIERNKSVYEDVIKKYIQYKQQRGYIDYDDILSIVAYGLKKNKEAANYISSRYDHILIDEFQDTNPLQYELLSSFYDNCHIYCVGDDAQSIYGFRGADFKSMHNFTNVVSDAETMKLTTNYRSTQKVLDVANWVLKQSPISYEKDLKAARKDEGVKPKFVFVDGDWEEAEHITDDILFSKSSDGCDWSDCMVLSRSLFGLRKVEALCVKKEIPYTVFGGTGLMQTRHIRDIVSALRIVSNFRDELAWERYLMLWEKIGEVTAARIIQSLMGALTLKSCIDILRTMSLQRDIYETLQKLDGLQDNPAKAIKIAVECLKHRLGEIYKNDNWSWDSRKEDFPLLEEIATASASVAEFLAEFVLDPKLGSGKKDKGKMEDMVVLSTIHSAKGLEAKNVYIVKCGPFNYPTQRAILNGFDAIEEERRCLYVAVTRAKDKLYLYKDIRENHLDNGHSSRTDDYSGEIRQGMTFINKLPRLGIKATVEHIDEDGTVYWHTDEGIEISLDQWNFRRQYLPETDFKQANNNSLYFLNEIPSSLIDKVTVNNAPAVEDSNYKGKMVNTGMEDLDFS